ncbi:MAG TPA: hypothetical protein VN922_07810, partial [Bacteroidia bacterium]|nr:hypothetical protein [Bacteroidia bacterium]
MKKSFVTLASLLLFAGVAFAQENLSTLKQDAAGKEAEVKKEAAPKEAEAKTEAKQEATKQETAAKEKA